MNAIQLDADRELSMTDVPRPEISPTDVFVRVDAAGVCGSDVGAYLGKASYDFLTHPRTLGHEYAGTVAEVGSNVTEFRPGDHVVERPLRTCGRCSACQRDRENVCEHLRLTGFHDDGAFTTHVSVPDQFLHRVPEGIPSIRAAMTEPLAVAYRGVVEVGGIDPGESVLVLGPGPIGSLSGLVADRAGGEVTVVGLPHDERRLSTLADLGLETTIVDPGNETLPHPTDFDVTIDATGSASGVRSAVDATRNGGRVVVLGIPAGQLKVPGTEVVRSEIAIRPSYAATAADFVHAVSLQSGSRAIPAEKLAVEYGPAEANAAFTEFSDAAVIKPMFRPVNW